jgi:hypothetical protein
MGPAKDVKMFTGNSWSVSSDHAVSLSEQLPWKIEHRATDWDEPKHPASLGPFFANLI